MKYIHTPEDATGTFSGFGNDTVPGVRHEEPGHTTIVAGPPEFYERLGLNQFPTRRMMLGIHRWPPGKDHGSHHHPSWEQCYYIFSGQAEVTVGSEQKTIGPGCAAYMPAKVEHNIVAVGDEPMVAAVVTCVLDEDEVE